MVGLTRCADCRRMCACSVECACGAVDGTTGVFRCHDCTDAYDARACGHPGSNHSGDLIEVWSGRPEPRYVCGFHQSQELLD